MAKMSDDDLLVHLQDQERTSIGYSTDELSNEQDTALWRYLGGPYGDEEDGRSQVVSMDASQVVDWALPDLLEPFVSGQQAVSFEPPTEAEEPAAEQATAYVNYVFNIDNPGFEILHSAAKDGLVQKLGVTKISWDERERSVEQTYVGQSSTDLARFRGDDEVEVLDVESEKIALTPADQAMAVSGAVPPILQAFPDSKVYTIKIEHTERDGRIGIESVPPEEFRISSRASSAVEPDYIGHTCEKTKSQIIELGFPESDVEPLSDTNYNMDQGRDIRFYNQPHDDREGQDWRMAKRWLHEEYVPIDWNGDGDIEVVQVFRVGNTILSSEEVACNPFATFSPFPMPHSAIGQGMVDKVKQTNRIKTVLERKMLDAIYLSVDPQREVPEQAVTDDGSTFDDILGAKTGSIIRTKQPGMMREVVMPDTSSVALQGLQYMDTVREAESGVVRAPIGLSAEAVDKELSATEAAQIERGSLKRDRLMARVFAEMYLAPLFSKILKYMVQYQNKPRSIRLHGKWVEMDPRTWNANMSAVPAVGLGYDNRDAEAAAATVIGNAQERLTDVGMAGPEQYWETAKLLVKAVGQRFPDKYFIDPTAEGFQPPEPQKDPAMAQVEAKAQLEQQKLQQDGQLKQAELQQDGALAQAKMQMDGQIQMAKAQMQAEVDVLKAQMTAAGNDEKARADFITSMEKTRQDFEASLAKIQIETELAVNKQDAEVALALREQDLKATLKAREDTLKTNGSGLGRPVQIGGEIG